MSDKKASWPKPRVAMLQALGEAESRQEEENALALFDTKRTRQVFLTSAPERALAALGVMILERLSAAGGSPVVRRDLEALCHKLFDGYGHEELVALEHEAFECLSWVGAALNEAYPRDPFAHQEYPEDANQEMTHLELVGWAIYRGKDLELSYFDPDTVDLTEHHVTPTSVDAARYLRVISHTTKQEEVFRLDRITGLHPVGGWPVHRVEHLNPPPPPRGYTQPVKSPKSQVSMDFGHGNPGYTYNPDDEEE